MNKKTLVSLLLVMSMLFSLVPCMSLSASAAVGDQTTDTVTLFEYITMDGKEATNIGLTNKQVGALEAKLTYSEVNTGNSYFFGGKLGASPTSLNWIPYYMTSTYHMTLMYGKNSAAGITTVAANTPYTIRSVWSDTEFQFTINGTAKTKRTPADGFTWAPRDMEEVAVCLFNSGTSEKAGDSNYHKPDAGRGWKGNVYNVKLYDTKQTTLLRYLIPGSKVLKDKDDKETGVGNGYLDLVEGKFYTNNFTAPAKSFDSPSAKTLGKVRVTYTSLVNNGRRLDALSFDANTQEDFNYQAALTIDVPESVAIEIHYDPDVVTTNAVDMREDVTLCPDGQFVEPDVTYNFIDYAVVPAGAYFKTPFTPELVSGLKAKASVSGDLSSLTYDVWFFGNRYTSGYYSFLRVPGEKTSTDYPLQPTQYIQPGAQLRGTAVTADDTPFEVDSYAVPGRHIFNANGTNNDNANDVAYPAANEWHNLAFFVPGGGQAANFKYGTTMGWRGTAYWMKLYRDGGPNSEPLNAAGRDYERQGNLEKDLIAYYVPAKDAENKVGFYDLVSGEFYVSEGTKQFTVGTETTESFVTISGTTGYKTYGVSNVDELRVALNQAVAGDTIKFMANIAIDDDDLLTALDLTKENEVTVDYNDHPVLKASYEMVDYIQPSWNAKFDTGVSVADATDAVVKLTSPVDDDLDDGTGTDGKWNLRYLAYNSGVLMNKGDDNVYKALLNFYNDRNKTGNGVQKAVKVHWAEASANGAETNLSLSSTAWNPGMVMTVNSHLGRNGASIAVSDVNGVKFIEKVDADATIDNSGITTQTYQFSYAGRNRYYSGKVYRIELGDADGKKLCDYIPVVVDGKPAFYDSVSKKLKYAEAGSFTAGNAVGAINVDSEDHIIYEVASADAFNFAAANAVAGDKIVLTANITGVEDYTLPADVTLEKGSFKVTVGVYSAVATAEKLEEALANTKAKSVILAADIDTDGATLTVPAGCVLNLNGHRLKAGMLTAKASGALVIDTTTDTDGVFEGTLEVDEIALLPEGTNETYNYVPAPVTDTDGYKFYSVLGDLFDENYEKTYVQTKEDGDQAAFVFALGKDFQSKIRKIFKAADEGSIVLKLEGKISADSEFTVNGENSKDTVFNFDYDATGAITGATEEIQNVYVLFSGFKKAPSVSSIDNVKITLDINHGVYQKSTDTELSWIREEKSN